jgi:hypothetical protein
VSDFQRTLDAAITRRGRYEKQRTWIAAILCLLVAAFLVLTWSDRQTASGERQSLIHAVDLLRWQQQQCANLPAGAPECATPIVPPPSEILKDPSSIPTTVPPTTTISSAQLEESTRAVLADMLPPEVAAAVGPAVASYVNLCVAVGDCVGPAGPVGATGQDGNDPSPAQVTAAVIEACRFTLDCEVSDQDVIDAVATYCGLESQPCGHRWTEDEIRRLASQEADKAIAEWSSGRPWWCVPEDEVPNDQAFGPCYASVG